MKIVQINTVCGKGSTGKICVEISKLLYNRGDENYIFYASGKSDYPLGKRYMSYFDTKIQSICSRVRGNYGFNSKNATKRLINHLERIKPDIVHLHNLHGHNIHLELLFSYLNKSKIKVVWTFHDCWAFTGYCTYYDLVNCDKWKNGGCACCPQKKKFAWFLDKSRELFNKKKELLTDSSFTIITPSQWLADQVSLSFLSAKQVNVIINGIDLSVFTPRKSSFRDKHNLGKKYIVLGVAFGWGARKGLDVFVELSKRLDEKYQIVLVGTSDSVEQQLPSNIISIRRTNNQAELAEIYSAANVFVNPTREEVLGMTNLEALACGTPVITFNSGGSPECIDEKCGFVVDKDDVDSMGKKIVDICARAPFSVESCVARAKQFNSSDKFLEYLRLYDNLTK